MEEATNLTHLEEDPFAAPPSPDLDHGNVEDIFNVWFIVTLVLEILISAASIGACIFLIYALVKFKRLKTRLNRYFLHYAICTVVNFVFTPVFYLLLFISGVRMIRILICISYEIEMSFLLLSFVFATAPVVDWYMSVHYTEKMRKFKKFQKYVFAALYGTCLVKIAVQAASCFTHGNFTNKNHMLIIGYLSFLVTICVVFLLARYKKTTEDGSASSRTRYAATVGTFIMLGWFPVLMFHFLFDFFYIRSFVLTMVLLSIGDIPKLFAFSLPIIVVFLLGKYDNGFKMAYDTVLKRSGKDYQSDLNEDLEDDENFLRGEA